MIQTLLPFRYISALLFILLAGAMTGGDMYAQAVRFSEPADTVREGSESVTLEVILLEEGSGTWELVFQSNLSSATPEDFIGSPGRTISFPPGAPAGSRQQFTLRLSNDTEFEQEKHATFLLKSTEAGSQAVSVFRLVIEDDDRPGVTITELLADPQRDTNGDGSAGGSSDRFIELYNGEESSVDLSGWTLSAGDGQIIHRFAEGDVIHPGSAMVLFGSERWSGSFGGSRVIGVPALRLNSRGDRVTLADSDRMTIDQFTYGPAGTNTGSWTKEIGAETVAAHMAGPDGSAWSPGRRTDGSWFSDSYTLQGDAGWRVISVPGEHLPTSDLLPADMISEANGTGSDRGRYYTGYDGEQFIRPEDNPELLERGGGMLVYYPGDAAGEGIPATLDPDRAEAPEGNVVVPLHAKGDRWNLLGNPWREAIDLRDIISRTRGGELESEVVQIWDGQLKSFVPLSVHNGIVEPWQGFFVRNSSATALELPHPSDADRSPGRLEEVRDRKIAFTLSAEEGMLKDRAAVVTFREGADHQWDSGDGEKLSPLSDEYVLLGIRGTKEGEPVLKSQDSRPLDFTGELNIQLAVDSRNYDGPMKLQWNMDRLPEEWEVSLYDRITGETVDLKTDESHSFAHQGTPMQEPDGDQRPRLETVPDNGNDTPRFRLRVIGRSEPEIEETLPQSVKLNPNYPNPFSTSTTISFELSENTHVTLSVWNMLGQKVATLVDEVVEAGEHEQVWNAGTLPSTIYIIHLEVNGVVYNRKMALIK